MELEYQYLVAKLQHAIATDESVSMLDVKVVISAGKIHVTGTVPTEERRGAVDAVIARVLPGIPVRNELTILELSDRPEHERIHD
jgi:hypothetical protein